MLLLPRWTRCRGATGLRPSVWCGPSTKWALLSTIKCVGCGAPLQTQSPDTAGFMKPHIWDRLELPAPPSNPADLRKVVCQRCFRLQHYGSPLGPVRSSRSSMEGATATRLEGDAQQQRFVVPENQIRHFVRPLLARPCVVIQTVDLTNVEGSWLDLSPLLHPASRLIIVGTKLDALPATSKIFPKRYH